MKKKTHNNLDIEYFKKILEKEKENLERELSLIAKKNPKTGDWLPLKPKLDTQLSEKGEIADAYEELENRFNAENELEKRLNEVNDALERIQKGTYGVCEKTNKPISKKRLKANPTARTCVDHSG
jgi:DnaK suppressor protein